MIPADNTSAVKDSDMFKIMPKATKPYRVSHIVS